MRVDFIDEYRSIKEIGISIELPDFVVITGQNGSGKSHLLEAITYKTPNQTHFYVNVSDQEKNLQKRQLVTSINLPHNIGQTSYSAITEQRKGYYQQYRNYIAQSNATPTSINFESSVGYPANKIIKKIAENAGKSIRELTYDDFVHFAPIEDYSYANNMFTSNLSYLFKNYHGKWRENKFREFLHSEGRNVQYWSEEGFTLKFGEPPWELINKIFEAAALDYLINSPNLEDDPETPFEPLLTNKINNAIISFNDLSSGEKVLISLALSLYNSRFDVDVPELLLLDEPDAPLHPSMIKSFLNTIQTVFVKEKGIKVILTTHSPSTVALAPEESLFVMNKTNPRLEKVSKDKALRILTSGVPSLSIHYENRRQIFVESKYDISFYERIYQKMVDILDPEISLNFVTPNSSGESDCGQVKYIVDKLRKCGNTQTFGIIDWDAKNNGNDFVKVLGKNKRYSIENYIFDPVLVGCYLLREKLDGISKTELGMQENESYFDLKYFDNDRLQIMSNTILEKVKNKIEDIQNWPEDESQWPSDCNKETVKKIKLCKIFDVKEDTVSYVGGKQITISKWFLNMQGHSLEYCLKETFPELKRHRREGDLKNEFLLKVIDDLPELISEDLKLLLLDIQNT